MEDQYALTDLRNLITDSRPHPHFPPPPPQPPQDHHLFHRNQHYHEMMMMGRHHIVSELINPRVEYHCDSISLTTTTAPTSSPAAGVVTTAAAATSASAMCGFEVEGLGGMLDGGSGRWPRQETLTLLEIRSRLDSKFKEANQKGPLWDEVSRIMCEEHGYQRSGKKCREKFENLYKYYKKTKEGKAGRQDGKHYRFFRQLEALYGETSNSVTASDTPLVVGNTFHFLSPRNNTSIAQTSQHQELEFQQVSQNNSKKHYDSPSFSNSSDYDTSNNSSEDDDRNTGGQMENDDSIDRKKRKSTRSWKAKIKDFIDSQMKRLIEKQEAWLEKMLKTIERREHDRLMREEDWRKQEADRLDREHKFWASERAWIEARDAALMEALQKLTGSKDHVKNSSTSTHEVIVNEIQNLKASDQWTESAVSKLVQLRTSMDNRFQQSECSEQALWEEIAAKMACLGYEKSGFMCKDKWESISNYLMMMRRKECNKKRKENLRSCCDIENKEAFYSSLNHGGPYCEINEQGPETAPRLQPSNGSSPSNSNAAGGGGGGNSVVAHDSCLRFLMGEGENLWENTYGGVNLNKGE